MLRFHMNHLVVVALCVFLAPRFHFASAQERVKPSEQASLQKVLKVIRDPNLSYEIKEAAFDRASRLSPAARNTVDRAMFLQNNAQIALEGFNGLFSDQTSAVDRADNWKFVRDNITKVRPETQSYVLHQLALSVGIQTPDQEILYHTIARRVAQQHTAGGPSSDGETSEALSRASFLLALSPLYDNTDKGLLLKASRVSNFFAPLALALSRRHLLDKPIFQQLKHNYPGISPQNIALQVTAATVDPAARTQLISTIRTITRKKYRVREGVLDFTPVEDARYISMLRFVDFPEKKGLIVAASHSKTATIQHAAFLVAAEDYPEVVIGNASVKSTFLYQENYHALMTYLALRHPAHTRKVRADIRSRLFDQTAKKLREVGVLASCESSGGFVGM